MSGTDKSVADAGETAVDSTASAPDEEEGLRPHAPPQAEPVDRSGEPLMSAQHVYYSVDDTPILEDISFDVYRGEIFGIMGMSGSGKTTLLRLLIGLDRPTSGHIFFKGEDITRLDEDGLNRVRRSMGMCFQYSALFDSMTVAENVAFSLRNRTDISQGEIDRRVRELLDVVEMGGTEDRMPADLSGGMKKRVGIARALMEEPELVLYDEPSSGLDPVMGCNITALIKKVRADTGSTAIVVSHDVSNMLGITDRMLMLHERRVQVIGTPQELLASDSEIVHRFVHAVGTGPMTEHCSVSPQR
ncbi:MAG: ATP-binding cassette domain-containing protein [Armatimonadota bacterium]|nr:ATP-binding cassette domain-containing protein [Armatimonadota bacterium]